MGLAGMQNDPSACVSEVELPGQHTASPFHPCTAFRADRTRLLGSLHGEAARTAASAKQSQAGALTPCTRTAK